MTRKLMSYSNERKEAVLKKMVPPNNRPIAQIAREEGIREATLYNWRQNARAQVCLLPDSETHGLGYSAAEQFAAVVESAALNEAELSAYCRRRGLYPEQIAQWREACEQVNDWNRAQLHKLKASRREDEGRIKRLERELPQKEKALAETAALLVLSKKAEATWGVKDV